LHDILIPIPPECDGRHARRAVRTLDCLPYESASCGAYNALADAQNRRREAIIDARLKQDFR
jgi:hypothetical protein